ncbi:MAG: hypothetical protein Ta2E_06430 [Mycoplasmoidaceae bacterium]|nr:MAG: hypothetical protein Ta2E_06430 [Mycoplasmoidaceae bacterium]
MKRKALFLGLFGVACGAATVISMFYATANGSLPQFPSSTDDKDENVKESTKAGTPTNLTSTSLTWAVEDAYRGNMARIGTAHFQNAHSWNFTNWTNYDTIKFVNSGSVLADQFATQVDAENGNKLAGVRDINVIDFNNDTNGKTFSNEPEWYASGENTLRNITNIQISDETHANQYSPLTELGFYTFSNIARRNAQYEHQTNGQMFSKLNTVKIYNTNPASPIGAESPVGIKIVHNGAFYRESDTNKHGTGATLTSVDFGPSNRLTVMDEPNSYSPYQDFGFKYTKDNGGDFSTIDSNNGNPYTGIFYNQENLINVDLYQNYYGASTTPNPASLLNIPDYAFWNCKSLKSIQGGRDRLIVNNNVVSILNFPTSIKKIGSHSFAGVNPEVVNFPTNLEALGTKIFGENGSDKLRDIIFSNPAGLNASLTNYDWNSLFTSGRNTKVKVHVPYLDSYGTSQNAIQNSPYYAVFNDSRFASNFELIFNHATDIHVESNLAGSFPTINGKSGATGVIDISATPLIVRPNPTYSYIGSYGNWTGNTGNLMFTPSIDDSDLKLTIDSSCYARSPSDGMSAIKVNQLKYELKGSVSNEVSFSPAFSQSYADAAILNNTITSSQASPMSLKLWTVDNPNNSFVFTPATGTLMALDANYAVTESFNTLTTKLTFDGTGLSSPTESLTISPKNAANLDPNAPIASPSFLSFVRDGTDIVTAGSVSGSTITKSTIVNKSNLTYTAGGISQIGIYQITPEASLTSSPSTKKVNTVKSSIYSLNVWGIEGVTLNSAIYAPNSTTITSQEKENFWNGSATFTYRFPQLKGAAKFYQSSDGVEVRPVSPLGVSYEFENVKKDGNPATKPDSISISSTTGEVSIANDSTNYTDGTEWTFDVKVSSLDDTTKFVTIPYKFKTYVVTGLSWKSSTMDKDKIFTIDRSSLVTPTTLKWEINESAFIGRDPAILSITCNASSIFGTNNPTTFSYNNSTGIAELSWSSINWTSASPGKKTITVEAHSTSPNYTIRDTITIYVYALDHVTIASNAISFTGSPLKVGSGSGTSNGKLSIVPSYVNGSSGQPANDDLIVTWTIAATPVSGGTINPSWLHATSPNTPETTITYDNNFEAGDWTVIPTVKVRTEASAPEHQYTRSSSSLQIKFKAWSIAGSFSWSVPSILTSRIVRSPNTASSTGALDGSPKIGVTISGTSLPTANVSWTLNPDIVNSTPNVWNQSATILPTLSTTTTQTGFKWGKGLKTGSYRFTITATSVADPSVSETWGVFCPYNPDNHSRNNSEFDLYFESTEYGGTVVDGDIQKSGTRTYNFESGTTHKISLQVLNGLKDPSDPLSYFYDDANNCYWKLSGWTANFPNWIRWANDLTPSATSPVVGTNGQTDLLIGTDTFPITYGSTNTFKFSLQLYSASGTTVHWYTSNITINVFKFGASNANENFVLSGKDSAWDWYGHSKSKDEDENFLQKEYKFNPKSKAKGNTDKPNFKYNFTKNPSAKDISLILHPQLTFTVTLWKTNSDGTTTIAETPISIVVNTIAGDANYGQVSWSMDVKDKSKEKETQYASYTGKYFVIVNCYYLSKDDSLVNPKDPYLAGSGKFILDYSYKKSQNNIATILIVVLIIVGIGAGVFIYLFMRRKKMYAKLKSEDSEDSGSKSSGGTGMLDMSAFGGPSIYKGGQSNPASGPLGGGLGENQTPTSNSTPNPFAGGFGNNQGGSSTGF